MDIKEILEKALRGRAVVLRNGKKAYVRHVEKKLGAEYPVIGFIERSDGSLGVIEWALNGRIFTGGAEWPFDIIGLAPLEFDHWDLLGDGIESIKKQEDGQWYAYRTYPVFLAESSIGGGGEFLSLAALNRSIFPECDWQDSLIVRPVNGDSE